MLVSLCFFPQWAGRVSPGTAFLLCPWPAQALQWIYSAGLRCWAPVPSSPLPAQVSPLSAQTVSGLSSESLGLKLLGSVLENKHVVCAGDKESLQPQCVGMNWWGAECWHAQMGLLVLLAQVSLEWKIPHQVWRGTVGGTVTVELESSEGSSPWTTVKLQKTAFPDKFVHACYAAGLGKTS